MFDTFASWLERIGLSETIAGDLSYVVAAIFLILLAVLANFVAKQVLLRLIGYFVKRSRTGWDDALARRKVFLRLSHIAPALVFYYGAYLFPPVQDQMQRFSMVYMILVGLLVSYSFMNAIVDIYNTYPISRQRPIKGYVQIFMIIFSIFVIVLALATALGRSPWPLLGGLGTMTAILILVFKDSILGFVASVQLTTNDMVRIGDWIDMPKYGADGDVVDVTLHTVKVQNWDKTITTIPAYSLISDSFRNWRGMKDSGGRRIKRAINVDMTSIKFCTAEMLERFRRYQLLEDYLDRRLEEVMQYNREHNVDTSELINGRNLTNVGTFRAYLEAYLRNHPKIHQNMTFLVRQLPPGEHGLPIEIYVFSNDQVWANYEAIQADIFDHILAVIPWFELRVFQRPSGADLTTAVSGTSN
jgi:miniconductance mechanosensitive channel